MLSKIHEHQASVPIDGTSEDQVVTEGFQGLRAEVKASSTKLENMEMELRQQLLEELGKVLQDEEALKTLEALVSGVQGGWTGPAPAAQAHLSHPYPSWSRASAVTSGWSLWTVQQVPSLSVWCSPLGSWCRNLPLLSSTWWGH
jgi:hypothetical protein